MMEDKLSVLLNEIQKLEREVTAEIAGKGKEFLYVIKNRKVQFDQPVLLQHRLVKKHVLRYLRDAHFLNLLTTPIIWSNLVPALFLDLVVSLFQFICFPVYGIPKVRRGDYIVLDHRYLGYLNLIEKTNCVYCSYFNGVMGYVQEIGARTEQYWCPIKHSRAPKFVHNRYKNFIDYGDSKRLHQRWNELRKSFDELK